MYVKCVTCFIKQLNGPQRTENVIFICILHLCLNYLGVIAPLQKNKFLFSDSTSDVNFVFNPFVSIRKSHLMWSKKCKRSIFYLDTLNSEWNQTDPKRERRVKHSGASVINISDCIPPSVFSRPSETQTLSCNDSGISCIPLSAGYWLSFAPEAHSATPVGPSQEQPSVASFTGHFSCRGDWGQETPGGDTTPLQCLHSAQN